MKNRIINISAFLILTLLWLAFITALIINQQVLITAWQTLRGWPLIIQLAVWLLTLPVTLGLWIWQTTWPLVLRLVLIVALAWATLFVFFPKKESVQTSFANTRS